MFLKRKTQKINFVVGDFNLNCLDYNENLEIRTFRNRIFALGCIPLITRPTSNISHKLLRPSQFLEKCMEILEWSTLQR